MTFPLPSGHAAPSVGREPIGQALAERGLDLIEVRTAVQLQIFPLFDFAAALRRAHASVRRRSASRSSSMKLDSVI